MLAATAVFIVVILKVFEGFGQVDGLREWFHDARAQMRISAATRRGKILRKRV